MYIRKIDSLGRLPIPQEIMQKAGLEKETPLSIRVLGESLLIEKHTAQCALCGASKDLSYFKDKCLCESCIAAIRQRDIPLSEEVSAD